MTDVQIRENRSEGPESEDCQLKEGSPAGTAAYQPYYVSESRMFYRRPNQKHGSELVNAHIFIIKETVVDNGVDEKVLYLIGGILSDGTLLPQIWVPAEQFDSFRWVSKWGLRVVISAGFAAKDHTRAAIMLLSENVGRSHEYSHLGWRRINGELHFLNASGAITRTGLASNVTVNLGDRLKSYSLPSPPEGAELISAIRASLSFLALAPLHITVPIFAGIYLAPLGEVVTIDFALFVVGRTGARKSEVSAMVIAHFGRTFSRLNLPGSWSSTANALEYLAFLAKNVVFVIDDFKPVGSGADQLRLHKEADRLLRGAGNGNGRSRMTADGKLRPEYFVRGLVLSTGEETPFGESLRARNLITEVQPNDIDLSALTRLQRDAASGLLSQSMSGYIRWLASRDSIVDPALLSETEELRGIFSSEGLHGRTPDILSKLEIGWRTFLDYALESGAIDQKEYEAYRDTGRKHLLEIGSKQADHCAEEDPTKRFIELTSSALVTGQAHLVAASRIGGSPSEPQQWGWRPDRLILNEWVSCGHKIGWVDQNAAYLNPEATFNLVMRLSRDQGNPLPMSKHTLWKRLAERGWVVKEQGTGKNTVKKVLEGTRKRVLLIPNKNLLIDPEAGAPGALGPTDNHAEELCPRSVPPE